MQKENKKEYDSIKNIIYNLINEEKLTFPEDKLFYTAIYEGAAKMYDCYLNKQRKYYDAHREHNREYQRAYQKARRDKAKEVEESK